MTLLIPPALSRYVYKGHDKAQVEVTLATTLAEEGQDAGDRVIDEIQQFQEGRYVGAAEAMWRNYKYKMHDRSSTVMRLPIHLPGQEAMEFDGDVDLAAVIQQGPDLTALTHWFRYNQLNEDGHGYTYAQFPTHYTFTKNGGWKKRMRQDTFPALGRIYFISRKSGELFYLRMLLNHVKGAKSYEDLRTVMTEDDQGERLCPTFQEAAKARGLLEDDNEAHEALREATANRSAHQMRVMFAIFLAYNSISDPLEVWTTHKVAMCEDIHHRLLNPVPPTLPPVLPLTDAQQEGIEHQALREIDDLLKAQGIPEGLGRFPDLPQPPVIARPDPVDAERDRYDLRAMEGRLEAGEPLLRPGQRQIYDTVLASVAALSMEEAAAGIGNVQAEVPTLSQPATAPYQPVNEATQPHQPNQAEVKRIFFVDSPGGCGKTFTLNLLLDKIRSQGEVAIAVASSGIAALLMEGGTTAHSRFKIPIDLHSESICNLGKQSEGAKLLKAAKLIVWDEAPMMHKHCYAAVDRLLQDLMGNELPFGGKVFVMTGDFRQVLPVVPRGSRAAIVNSCVKRHELWQHVKVMKLTENMRVNRLLATLGPEAAAEQQAFADSLLRIGEGAQEEGIPAGHLRIPQSMKVEAMREGSTDPSPLIDAIYGDLGQIQNRRDETLIERCILAPKNDHVNDLNDQIATKLPGRARDYYSADYANEEAENLYSREFLNSLNPQGEVTDHVGEENS